MTEIGQLRKVHEDRAVLEVFRYGWDDLAQSGALRVPAGLRGRWGFGVRGWGFGRGRNPNPETRTPKPKSRRRKPYRLRWPDEFRDEVLARLLELNEQRAKEKALAGTKSDATKPKENAKPKESAQKETLF